MAKAKISQEEVNEICNHLLEVEQTEPQIRNVRAMLGAGSNSTIARMIDFWSDTRQKTTIDSDEIDPSIVKAINSVISKRVNAALSKIREDSQRMLEDKNDALAENKRLGVALKDQEHATHLMVETNAELKARYDFMQKSYEDIKSELIDKSKQLVKLESDLKNVTDECTYAFEKLMAYESQEAEYLKVRDQLTCVQGQLKTQRQLEELLHQTQH